jgi:uncharacterized membrane protein
MIPITKRIKYDLAATSIFYIISGIVVFYLIKSGKYNGGPCNPGLGPMSFLLLGLFTIVLLIRSIVLSLSIYKNQKLYKYSLIINFLAFVIWVLISVKV